MRAIFESRFMRVVLSDGSQMIDVELNTEFERFQHEVRNLSMWRPTIEEIRKDFLFFICCLSSSQLNLVSYEEEVFAMTIFS